jgi:hypothetical protein
MRQLVSSVAVAAAVLAAGAANAGVHVQVWFVDGYGSQLQADESTYGTLGPASATFDYSGPIDWIYNAPQGSPNLMGQFLDGSDISNLTSSDSLAQLLAENLSQPGVARQTFFRVAGTYSSAAPAAGSITHDDGASVYFNGSSTATVSSAGWTSAATNTFVTPAAAPGSYLIDYVEGNGSPSDLIFTTGVPEPATWTMMALGIGGLGAMARRRRAVSAALA